MLFFLHRVALITIPYLNCMLEAGKLLMHGSQKFELWIVRSIYLYLSLLMCVPRSTSL